MRKCVGEVIQVVAEVTQVVGEMKQFCWGSDTKFAGEVPKIQIEITPATHVKRSCVDMWIYWGTEVNEPNLKICALLEPGWLF